MDTKLLIGIIIGLVVGGAGGYVAGMKLSAPAPIVTQSGAQEKAKVNPLQDIQVNPYETIKTNPFE